MSKKLSESRKSKKYLEEKEGIKSKPIPKDMKQKLEQSGAEANRKIKRNNSIYNQSKAHSNETIICDSESQAKKFVDNIENMRNPHIRDCVSLEEKYGTIEDYTHYQEIKDLESYRRFLNSSAYDDVKEAEGSSWSQLLSSDIKDCRTCQNMSCTVEHYEKPVEGCLGYINHDQFNDSTIRKILAKRKK